MGSEHLGRSDGNPSLGKRDDVDFRRQPARGKHLFPFLIVDDNIIKRQVVGESVVGPPDSYGSAQHLAHNRCHLAANILLNWSCLKANSYNQVQAKQSPYNNVKYILECFQICKLGLAKPDSPSEFWHKITSKSCDSELFRLFFLLHFHNFY